MARTSFGTKSVLAAMVAALAVFAGTAAADDGGPQITAGTGCAVQCVKKAAVTATASSAQIELQTTVVAVVTVWVARQGAPASPGTLAASQGKAVKLYMPAGTTRTTSFDGLEPDTTYVVGVKATDVHGQSSTRTGTFKTLSVKTNGIGGPDALDSGLGCSTQCITKALFAQAPPDGSVANADLKTSTPAKLQLIVGADLAFHEIVFDKTNPWLVRSWKPQIGGLRPGTAYHVVVRATDSQGRISERRGTFRTVSATALVTIQKIKIVADGDKGSNKGELRFLSYFAGKLIGSMDRYRKLGSGAVFTPTMPGTSRAGVYYRFPANGDATIDVRVYAGECDWHDIDHCLFVPDSQSTEVGGTFRLADILSGLLPGWYGTGVTQPAGHDGYFVFGPGNDYVKIQVLATVDIDYEWPS